MNILVFYVVSLVPVLVFNKRVLSEKKRIICS